MRVHPTRNDLFVSVERCGETSLWRVSADSEPIRVLTLPELASAVDLVHAAGQPFETTLIVGTHYGELRLYNASGTLLHESRTPTGADIAYVVHSDVDGSIVTIDIAGNIDCWSARAELTHKAICTASNRPTGLLILPQRGLIVASNRDGLLRLLDLNNRRAVSTVRLAAGDHLLDGVLGIAAAVDESQVAVALSSSVAVFSVDALLTAAQSGSTPSPTLSFPASNVGDVSLLFGPGDVGVLSTGEMGRGIRLMSSAAPDSTESYQLVGDAEYSSLAISKDGSLVVTGSEDGPPRLWTLGLAQATPPIRVSSHRISEIAMAHNSMVAASSQRGSIAFVGIDGTAARNSVDVDDTSIYALDLSPDARHVAYGGNGLTFSCMTLSTNEVTRHRFGSEVFSKWASGGWPQISCIKFLADGQGIIAVSSWGDVGMWRLGAPEPEHSLSLPAGMSCRDISVRADGTGSLIALALGQVTGDSRVDIYDQGGALRWSINKAHPNSLPDTIEWTAEGDLLVTARDSPVALWHHEGSAWRQELLPYDGQSGVVRAFSVRWNSGLCVTQQDGSIQSLAKAATGRSARSTRARVTPTDLRRWGRSVTSARALPTGHALVQGTEDGYIIFWRLGLEPWPAPIRTTDVELPVGKLFGSSFPPVVCGIMDNSVKCWTSSSPPSDINLPQSLGIPASVAVHSERRLLAASYDDGRVVIISIDDPDKSVVLSTRSKTTGWLHFACDGHRLFHSSMGVDVIEVPRSDFTTAFVGPSALLPGERIGNLVPLASGGVAVAANGKYSLYNRSLLQHETISLPASHDPYWRFEPAAFSSSGDLVALSGTESITLLRRSSGSWEEQHVLSSWSQPTSLAISATSQIVASAHASGLVSLWNSATGEELKRLPIGQPVAHVAFSDDVLMVGTTAGVLMYYDAKTWECLGRSVLYADNMLTITASNHFSTSGPRIPALRGIRGGEVVSDADVVSALSPIAANVEIFHRNDSVARALRRLEWYASSGLQWFRAQGLFAQVGCLTATAYALTVAMLGLVWLASPRHLCAWAQLLARGSTLKQVLPMTEEE